MISVFGKTRTTNPSFIFHCQKIIDVTSESNQVYSNWNILHANINRHDSRLPLTSNHGTVFAFMLYVTPNRRDQDPPQNKKFGTWSFCVETSLSRIEYNCLPFNQPSANLPVHELLRQSGYRKACLLGVLTNFLDLTGRSFISGYEQAMIYSEYCVINAFEYWIWLLTEPVRFDEKMTNVP